METSSADLSLAEHLASPFALPGRPTKPLSFRLLPEGGMVVITADGRKLWFTLEEANTARAELGMPLVKPKPPKPPKKEEHVILPSNLNPPVRSRDGQSEMIVLPPDMKHLETVWNGKPKRH